MLIHVKTKSYHWQTEVYCIHLRKTGSLLCIYLNDKTSVFHFIVNNFFSFIGNILELSCLEVCLQPNFNYSLPSLNFSFVTFLKPLRETQTIMGIFLNHSNFQNFTRICQGITGEFKMCSPCLACKSKKSMDFISQERTSKGKMIIEFIKNKLP